MSSHRSFADITVSVVSYKSQDVLGACLESLPKGIQIRVFDNASSDGTVDLIRRRFPNVKLITSDENVGFGRGHNANLEQTSTPYALILNPFGQRFKACPKYVLTVIRNDAYSDI